MAQPNYGPGAQPLSLQNIFGSMGMNPTQSNTLSTQPGAMLPPNLFSYGNGASSTNGLGGWTGQPNYTHGESPAASMAGGSPYAAPNLFSGSYSSTEISKSAGLPAQKPFVDLFNTSQLPTLPAAPSGYLSNVPIYGPDGRLVGAPKEVSAPIPVSAMPILPPAPTNVPAGYREPDPVLPQRQYEQTTTTDMTTSRFLALTPATHPAEGTNLKIVRPVDLPPSDYRRDLLTAERNTLAYLTNLRNVGPSIRVWRRNDNAQPAPNPFLNSVNLSIKEYVGNATDIHISPSSTSSKDTYIAIGDNQGNVSVHLLPSAASSPSNTSGASSGTSTPSKTSNESVTCVLRVALPPGAIAGTYVARVFWHPTYPAILAIAYSDGQVSVWNLAVALQNDGTNADLLLATSSPLTYVRPSVSRPPLVVTVSVGAEKLSDVVLWSNIILASTASGNLCVYNVANGAALGINQLHPSGTSALVLATAPVPQAATMPLIASTNGDGSEIKLWRISGTGSDLVLLQTLTLPRQASPYVLSRYSFNNTFIIYNPQAGTAWELQLFPDENVLLPGNFFAEMRCHGLLMMANYDVLFKYSTEDIAIISYPKATIDKTKIELRSEPSSSGMVRVQTQSIIPTHAATTPGQRSATEYQQHMRELSTPGNSLSAITMTQVPPSAAEPLAPAPGGRSTPILATQTPGTTASTSSSYAAMPSSTPTLPASPPKSAYNTSVPIDITASILNSAAPSASPLQLATTIPSLSNADVPASVQGIVTEATQRLGEMIRQEQEQWTSEDKKFLLKVNDAMRVIPNVVAKELEEALARIPESSVDVQELAKQLAVAVSTPIGLSFKEQFSDVLVPGLEDATAKMLRSLDAKMKQVATQHSQAVATNDVARSVEPLVASLLQATTEMTKSINNVKIPQQVAALFPQPAADPLKFPASSSSTNAAAPVSQPAAPVTGNAPTPTKQRSASGSSNSSTAPVPKVLSREKAPSPTPSDSPSKASPSAAKGNKKEKPTTDKKEKAQPNKPASPPNGSAKPASPAPASSSAPSVEHPTWYWLFSLRNNITL